MMKKNEIKLKALSFEKDIFKFSSSSSYLTILFLFSVISFFSLKPFS
jgi:hypothetical protein